MAQAAEETTTKIEQATAGVPQKKSGGKKKTVLLSLAVIVLVLAGTGIGYVAGIQTGKKLAAQEITKKVTDLLNPLNALSSNPLFPNSVVGKVTSASAKEITVKQINGESKKVVLGTSTQITKQAKEVSASEIKKDTNVTVILKKDNNETNTATRVIIR
jgi:hypothetical protein